jgi:hypothetical protein
MARATDAAQSKMVRNQIQKVYGDDDDVAAGWPRVPPELVEESLPAQEQMIRAVPPAPGTTPRNWIDREELDNAEPEEGEGTPPPAQKGNAYVSVPREVVNQFMQNAGMDHVPVPRPIIDNIMQAMMRRGSRNATARSLGADGDTPSLGPVPRR